MSPDKTCHPMTMGFLAVVVASCGVSAEVGRYPGGGDPAGGDRFAAAGDQDPPSGDANGNPSGQVTFSDQQAEAAARIVATAQCDRLWADCSFYCGAAIECGSSHADCVNRYVGETLGLLDFPVGSTTLAARCAARLAGDTCAEMEFSLSASSSCEHAVVNGCAADADAHGMPYAWEGPADLGPLPTNTSIDLCTGISEWFSFALSPGESLALSWDGPGAFGESLQANLHVLRDTGVGEAFVESHDIALLSTTDGSTVYLQEAAGSLTYLLELSVISQPLLAPLRVWIVDGNCAPITSCMEAGAECGVIDDNCGGSVSCGDMCFTDEVCGSASSPNVCLLPCSAGCWFPDECQPDGYCG